jgi:hypothetical protein
MKKFLFTAYVIAIVALVPTVIVGYLHTDSNVNNAKPNTEISKDVTNGQDEVNILRLVKTF